MENKKILIFSPYYPPHTGGLESHADEFNKYLSEVGADIVVFTPRLPKDAPVSEMRYDCVEVIRFPAFEIIPNYPLPKFWSPRFWNLFFKLFKKDFNITISRTRFFFTSLLALTYSKFTKTKWVHIEHGSDFVQLSSKFKTKVAKIYDYTFGFLIFRFSDINISISRAVQKFVAEFDKRQSPIIYRGLNFESIAETLPNLEIKKEFENKIIISFVGRLYKWKGVEKSIQAIRSLPQEIKDKVIFLIVGNGEDFLYLKKISEKENAIKMLGNLTREKALGILKVSDIYIHSAYPGGGLSTSLLEAMCSECAIIATPNEGADEVIRNDENGILIKNPDAQEIAQQLILLFENKELRQKLSQQAKKDVLKNFSWEKSIEKYINIIEK